MRDRQTIPTRFLPKCVLASLAVWASPPGCHGGSADGSASDAELITSEVRGVDSGGVAARGGVAGLKPTLSLVYSSVAGNGDMGVGWSLAGPSVIAGRTYNVSRDGFATPSA